MFPSGYPPAVRGLSVLLFLYRFEGKENPACDDCHRPRGFVQLSLQRDVANAVTVKPACRDIRQRNSGIWPFAVISGFFATCLAFASTHTHNGLLC